MRLVPQLSTTCLKRVDDIRRKLWSASQRAERSAGHSALTSFLEVRNPGRFACFETEVSML